MSLSEHWVGPINFSFVYKEFEYKVHGERIKVKEIFNTETATNSFDLEISCPEGIVKAKYFDGLDELDKEFEPAIDFLLKKYIFLNDHFREETSFEFVVEGIKHIINAYKISNDTVPGDKDFKLNWSLEIVNDKESIHTEFFPDSDEMFDVLLHPKIKEAIFYNLT